MSQREPHACQHVELLHGQLRVFLGYLGYVSFDRDAFRALWDCEEHYVGLRVHAFFSLGGGLCGFTEKVKTRISLVINRCSGGSIPHTPDSHAGSHPPRGLRSDGRNLLGEPSPDPVTAALEDLFLDSKGDPEDIGSRLDRHGKGDRAVTAHY